MKKRTQKGKGKNGLSSLSVSFLSVKHKTTLSLSLATGGAVRFKTFRITTQPRERGDAHVASLSKKSAHRERSPRRGVCWVDVEPQTFLTISP